MPLLSRYLVRRMVSGKCELPPSMIRSPGSRWGSSGSMKSSTALPALTISMILRGRFSRATISSMEWAPMMVCAALGGVVQEIRPPWTTVRL